MTDKTKIHSTNYFDTFIEVAEDTKAEQGTQPPSKKNELSIAEMQYNLISKNPYKYTSDEVFFQIYAERNDISEADLEAAKTKFFAKGQPCFRASPLTKTNGYGIHSDTNGNIAMYGMETEEYQKFSNEPKIKKTNAMRSSRK